MISLYSGTPGSGKSLHCARTIINWSRLGYPVIGNFTVDLSRYKHAAYTYCPNDQLTPKFLIEYSRNRFGDKHPKEGSILLVIDECQLLFNAREWEKPAAAAPAPDPGVKEAEVIQDKKKTGDLLTDRRKTPVLPDAKQGVFYGLKL